MDDVSILIPWRDSGDVNRQANLAKVLDHLCDTGLPVYLCPDGKESGPFNRSAAYNFGVKNFPSEVYVFHEADMLVPLEQLDEAVKQAYLGLGLVIPFRRYRYLSEDVSRAVIAGFPAHQCFSEWDMDHGTAVGAVGVASDETIKWVGGWDEKFQGHGYDDRAMHRAFEVACGPTRYVEGDGHHLWHPMAYAPWETDTDASHPHNFTYAEVEATVKNRARAKKYQQATSPEQIRELTGGTW